MYKFNIGLNKLKITTLLIALLLISLIFIPNISSKEESSISSTTSIAKWTFMTYFCFDTDIGKGSVKNDSREVYNILKYIGSTEDFNNVALYDTRYPDDITYFLHFN